MTKERPILFNQHMVNAILDGSKTQTRRIMKRQPGRDFGWHPRSWNDEKSPSYSSECQFRDEVILHMPELGVPGDKLWVRERWAAGACCDNLAPRELSEHFYRCRNGGLWYPYDGTKPTNPITTKGKNRQGMFMPRWASRITLVIDDVRAERLTEISEEDAIAEGCCEVPDCYNAVDAFEYLWDEIYGQGSFMENPWVWVIEFSHV